ncbi:GGDEF domain-containing protein [Actinoplanes sp. NPDC049316]|uniref:GGDEF domain-containing protein n=1 Tax=Actinoplanes sp. NPDC049316 TaxID=3154727 RepID=UPI00344A30AA
MVLKGYAALSFGLIAAYLFVAPDQRAVPFLLASLGAIPAAAVAVRRSRPGARLPWWLLLAAMVMVNVGNVLWAGRVYAGLRAAGLETVQSLSFTAGYFLLLGVVVVVIVRQAGRDPGGIIDSAITALALGGLLWDIVFLPRHQAMGTPLAQQAFLFIDVFVMLGILGALLRIQLVAVRRMGAVRWLTAGLAACLLANVAVVLTTDPATGAVPDWTNVPFLVAYVCTGCAALHHSAAAMTEPGPARQDDLSAGRLTFLGVMLALVPVVGGGRVILGMPADGALIALGSVILVPLVMLRVAWLAAQRRRAEQDLLRLATADVLTGLPNRAACLDRLSADLAAGGPQPGVAVLFCDLDGFKPVNDRLGHAAGDELLVAVAQRLRGCVREADLVSRFGGDEFVVVCRDHDPRGAVDAVCARIRDMVREPIPVAGQEVRIGVSAGGAFAGPGTTTDDLIRRADLAMYEAKRSKSVGALSLALA